MGALRKTAAALLTAALCLVGWAASAGAQGVHVPPGNGEADQYFEAQPGPGGPRSQDPGRDPTEILTQAEINQLDSFGPNGEAVVKAAAATAPDPAKRGRAGDPNGQAGGAGGGGQVGGGSTAARADPYLPSRDGFGGLFGWLIAAIAIGFMAYAATRWRGRGTA